LLLLLLLMGVLFGGGGGREEEEGEFVSITRLCRLLDIMVKESIEQ
jgi:hypothetical protein